MLDKKINTFLKELSKNNNREWFHAHKSDYEAALKSLELYTLQLIEGIRKFDKTLGNPTFKECVFRIHKDIRFSKDKTPYKTNMGVYIVKGGRKSGNAGYYLHIEPGNSMLAGGIYMPEANALKMIRKEVYYNAPEFKKIINDKHFKNLFGEIEGEKLVNPPRDFPKDFEDAELLKYKSYAVIHPISDAILFSEKAYEFSINVYSKMLPLNNFLNRTFLK